MKSPARRSRVALFGAVVAFVGSSCFDARQVDPGVLMIDDFEHGPFPSDSTFLPWQCYEFDPNTQRTYSCAYDTDSPPADALHDNEWSLRLDFEVADDPANEIPDYPGAALITYSTFGLYRDVTSFATLGFDVRVQSGNPMLPINTQVNVVLGCTTLAVGTAPGEPYVVQDWNPNPNGDWAQGAVHFVNFSPPGGTELVVADCLRRVDYVAFQVQPILQNGQKAAGTLHIDNIYLK
jgi:hypothetical protein